jgi:hypothetical protein
MSAAVDRLLAERKKAGLPDTIEDPAVLATVAQILRDRKAAA